MPSLKVVTYNIRLSAGNDGPNSWPFRAKRLCEYVAELDADIVGIQEALPDQVEALEKALPGYQRYGVGREDGKSKGEHCAIYIRSSLKATASGTFWFSDTPTVPNSMHWGNRITRITSWVKIEHPAGQIVVTNSHLDHESDESRRKSVLALTEFLEPYQISFLALGDFNMAPSNPNLQPLFKLGKDALAEADMAGKATFHGWNFGEGTDQIDYIFAAPHFELLDADSPRVPHSDHYPIVATYRFLG